MKLLHVESGRHLYGGALQVLFLLRGLQGLATEQVLVCPPDSAIRQRGASYADRVHAVPMRGDGDLLLIARLRRILRAEQPDLVHLHSRRGADVLGGIAARLVGVPAIVSRRVDNPEPRWQVAVKYRFHSHVVTISEAIRQVLLGAGLPPEKVTCVPSAVDSELYRPQAEHAWFRQAFALTRDERTVGMVAQFIPRKGHRVLLDAIPRVLHQHPRTRFLLFGQGPQQSAIRRCAERQGWVQRVVFAGFRDDLPRILPCLDLLVHPALLEGLGVSLLQAAACGLPVVASRVGGIPEIVRSGENGELVAPGDAERLAVAINRLLADRELAARYGKAGRERVLRSFSIRAMAEGNAAVYARVLGRPPVLPSHPGPA
ncbi:MAG: glycosyltransferase [Nitrococcus mobilis]|nr:glycosyltransferase [Nitrococcus mobilis]